MLWNEQMLVNASGKNSFQEIHWIYIYIICIYMKSSMYSCRKNDGIANKNDLFMGKSLKKTLLKQ